MFWIVLTVDVALTAWAAWRLRGTRRHSLPPFAAVLLQGWLIFALFQVCFSVVSIFFLLPLYQCLIAGGVMTAIIVWIVKRAPRRGSEASRRPREEDARLADDATLRAKGVLDER